MKNFFVSCHKNLIVFFSSFIWYNLTDKQAKFIFKYVIESASTKSEVVNWYLEEISGDIESQEELLEKKLVVEKVLDRLIYHDLIIIPLNNRLDIQRSKGTVSVVLSDPPCKDGNAWFTTVPLKALSDQVWIRD